jgi:hypothetical protein
VIFSADMTVAPQFCVGIGAGLAQNGGTRVITRFKKTPSCLTT